MKIDVNRLCELAGLGSGSRGLVTETVAPAPVKPGAVVPAKPAAVVPAKPGAPVKPVAAKPAAPVAEMHYMSDDDEGMEDDDMEGMYEMEGMEDDGMDGMFEMDDMEGDGAYMEDDGMYEINEEELAEALVSMRQASLDESYVRDAVREEIARALSKRGASWLYGKNQPTNSKIGQVVRGGYGIGFK